MTGSKTARFTSEVEMANPRGNRATAAVPSEWSKEEELREWGARLTLRTSLECWLTY